MRAEYPRVISWEYLFFVWAKLSDGKRRHNLSTTTTRQQDERGRRQPGQGACWCVTTGPGFTWTFVGTTYIDYTMFGGLNVAHAYKIFRMCRKIPPYSVRPSRLESMDREGAHFFAENSAVSPTRRTAVFFSSECRTPDATKLPGFVSSRLMDISLNFTQTTTYMVSCGEKYSPTRF